MVTAQEPGIPAHGKPGMLRINRSSPQINEWLVKLHAMATAQAAGVGNVRPVELQMNGRPCLLYGTVAYGSYLIETANEAGRPKVFYLVPSDALTLAAFDNRVPYVQCEPNQDFTTFYCTPGRQRRVHAYMVYLLSQVTV